MNDDLMEFFLKAIFLLSCVAVVVFMIAGCGGGSGGNPSPVNPMATTGGLQLRPCETTGPIAPPCPASQAASSLG